MPIPQNIAKASRKFSSLEVKGRSWSLLTSWNTPSTLPGELEYLIGIERTVLCLNFTPSSTLTSNLYEKENIRSRSISLHKEFSLNKCFVSIWFLRCEMHFPVCWVTQMKYRRRVNVTEIWPLIFSRIITPSQSQRCHRIDEVENLLKGSWLTFNLRLLKIFASTTLWRVKRHFWIFLIPKKFFIILPK